MNNFLLFLFLIFNLNHQAFAIFDIPPSHFEIDLQNETVSNQKAEMISLSVVATSLLATRINPEERLSKKAMTEYLSIRQELTSQAKKISDQFKTYFQSVQNKKSHLSFIQLAVDLLSTQDVVMRAMALGFLSNTYNAQQSLDRSRLILSKLLNSSQSSRSIILENKWLHQGDVKSLKLIKEFQSIETLPFMNYLIVGDGLSFFAMREIIKNIESEQDPVKKAKLIKSLSEASHASLLHVYNFVMGSVGQFDPISKNLIFSILSRVDEKSWAHEVEHYRFDQLTQKLSQWMKSKNYAMPYEIDGPAIEGGGEYGGLYTLLNELNSWRLEMSLGESENKSQSEIDRKILETFKTLYVSQVGPESIELMNQLWTDEFLSTRSIPRLIRKKVLELNSVLTDQIPDEIISSTDLNDFPRLINLLRLIQVRNLSWQNNSRLSHAILYLLSKNQNPEVHKLLRFLMKKDYYSLRTVLPVEKPELVRHQNNQQIKKYIQEGIDIHLVNTEFDKNLIQYLFDSGSTFGKLDIIARIVNQYLPSELPLTFNKVLSLLMESQPQPTDHLIARFFLMQEKQPQYDNYKWGILIHNQFNKLNHSEKNLEALFIFYQYNLPQKWKYPFHKLSPEDQSLIVDISQRLNYYSTSQSSMISMGAKAALYDQTLYSAEVVKFSCRSVIEHGVKK